MTFHEKREALAALDPEILLADGFEDALIGYVEIFSRVVAVYDRERCLATLMAQGMTLEDAEDYFSFNVTGAYVGEHTPAFLSKFPEDGGGSYRRAHDVVRACGHSRRFTLEDYDLCLYCEVAALRKRVDADSRQ
jgi:hypothetical protein